MIRHNDITIDRKTRTISRWFVCPDFCGAVSYHWLHKTKRTIEFNMAQHLLLAGRTTLGEIFDALYGADADGGPESGLEQVRVMLCHLKPKLATLGLQLISEKRAGRPYYHVARQTA